MALKPAAALCSFAVGITLAAHPVHAETRSLPGGYAVRFMERTEFCLQMEGTQRKQCLLRAQEDLLTMLGEEKEDPNAHTEVAKDVLKQITAYTTGIRALFASVHSYGTHDMVPILINSGVAPRKNTNGRTLHSYGDKPVDVLANYGVFHMFFSEISQETCTLVMAELKGTPDLTGVFMPESYYAERTTDTPASSPLEPSLCQHPTGTLVVVSK